MPWYTCNLCDSNLDFVLILVRHHDVGEKKETKKTTTAHYIGKDVYYIRNCLDSNSKNKDGRFLDMDVDYDATVIFKSGIYPGIA